MPQAKDVGIKI